MRRRPPLKDLEEVFGVRERPLPLRRMRGESPMIMSSKEPELLVRRSASSESGESSGAELERVFSVGGDADLPPSSSRCTDLARKPERGEEGEPDRGISRGLVLCLSLSFLENIDVRKLSAGGVPTRGLGSSLSLFSSMELDVLCRESIILSLWPPTSTRFFSAPCVRGCLKIGFICRGTRKSAWVSFPGSRNPIFVASSKKLFSFKHNKHQQRIASLYHTRTEANMLLVPASPGMGNAARRRKLLVALTMLGMVVLFLLFTRGRRGEDYRRRGDLTFDVTEADNGTVVTTFHFFPQSQRIDHAAGSPSQLQLGLSEADASVAPATLIADTDKPHNSNNNDVSPVFKKNRGHHND